MQCRDICEMLSPYIDGMLESSQAMQVEKHIAVCKACRLEYDDLRAAVELVRGLPEVVPPQEFHDNLRQKLQSLPVSTVTGSQTGRKSRMAWGKWPKTLVAAAVLFLTVGITALWFDNNEGGLFDTALQQSKGQLMADTAGRYGDGTADDERGLERVRGSAQEQAVKETKVIKEVGVENDAAQNKDRGNVTGSGESVSEAPSTTIRGAGEMPVPAVDGGGSGDAAAGGEPLAREKVALEGQPGSEDDMFAIMALPQEDLEDEHNATQLGDSKLQAGKNIHVAREYFATLTLNTQPAEAYWIEAAENYGGFVVASPQQTGQYWVLRIPSGSVDDFIKELNDLGQADIQSNSRDLATDVQRAEEQLNDLREREKVLIEQQGNAECAAELDALYEKIIQQQQALVELQEEIDFARFDLYLKPPNLD